MFLVCSVHWEAHPEKGSKACPWNRQRRPPSVGFASTPACDLPWASRATADLGGALLMQRALGFTVQGPGHLGTVFCSG